MRAALIEQIGEPPTVGEAAEPKRGPGQALVQVTAAALNPIDIAIGAGRFYGGSPDPPYIPGREAVGRVLEADTLEPGTQIWFMGSGTFAEYALADEASALILPDGTDHALAAALGIAGLTGWLAVEWRAHMRKGEKVLVLGATGVVGLVAVQAARILGAGRIVAAGRDAEALEKAREAGADAVVPLLEGCHPSHLGQQFREAAGGPVDVVIDPLWGEPAAAAVEAGAFSGRMVQLGQSAGAEATLRSGDIRGKSFAILGFTVGHVPRERQAEAYRRLLQHASSGELMVERETLPLDWAGEAWRRQERSPHRKLVLVP
jgi:NADPH:quinone reductase-like Zn-dependent oxidoreductase